MSPGDVAEHRVGDGWPMRDPAEGVDPAGFIVTGVGFDRFSRRSSRSSTPRWKPSATTGAASSLYLYGSVATGMAKSPTSDVDLLTFGMDAEPAEALAQRLSQEFADRCRSVDIAVAQPPDLVGSGRGRGCGGRCWVG